MKKQITALLILAVLGALVLVAGWDNSYRSLSNPDLNKSSANGTTTNNVPVTSNGTSSTTPLATPPLLISQTNSDIHKITLPHDEPDFPPGPGREIFMSRCTVCHTLRYITMQPNFSRKTWGKEVAKMINTFGAHITGEEARDIIEYLSTIKGLEHDSSAKVKQ